MATNLVGMLRLMAVTDDAVVAVMFTPTIMFFPQEVPEDQSAAEAAVAMMPGAFEADTTIHMLNWVVEEGYNEDEGFQRYHARRVNAETQ